MEWEENVSDTHDELRIAPELEEAAFNEELFAFAELSEDVLNEEILAMKRAEDLLEYERMWAELDPLIEEDSISKYGSHYL